MGNLHFITDALGYHKHLDEILLYYMFTFKPWKYDLTCYDIRTNNVIFSDGTKTFSGFSHLWNNKRTNNLYVSDCVILWPFRVCDAKCVIGSMSKHLPISTKFCIIISQCLPSRLFLFIFFGGFLLTFWFFWDLPIFLN